MSDDEVINFIIESLMVVAPERQSYFQNISLDSDVKNLGIDSIQTMELIGVIEDRLARTFAENELTKVHKIADLAALIRRN